MNRRSQLLANIQSTKLWNLEGVTPRAAQRHYVYIFTQRTQCGGRFRFVRRGPRAASESQRGGGGLQVFDLRNDAIKLFYGPKARSLISNFARAARPAGTNSAVSSRPLPASLLGVTVRPG